MSFTDMLAIVKELPTILLKIWETLEEWRKSPISARGKVLLSLVAILFFLGPAAKSAVFPNAERPFDFVWSLYFWGLALTGAQLDQNAICFLDAKRLYEGANKYLDDQIEKLGSTADYKKYLNEDENKNKTPWAVSQMLWARGWLVDDDSKKSISELLLQARDKGTKLWSEQPFKEPIVAHVPASCWTMLALLNILPDENSARKSALDKIAPSVQAIRAVQLKSGAWPPFKELQLQGRRKPDSVYATSVCLLALSKWTQLQQSTGPSDEEERATRWLVDRLKAGDGQVLKDYPLDDSPEIEPSRAVTAFALHALKEAIPKGNGFSDYRNAVTLRLVENARWVIRKPLPGMTESSTASTNFPSENPKMRTVMEAIRHYEVPWRLAIVVDAYRAQELGLRDRFRAWDWAAFELRELAERNASWMTSETMDMAPWVTGEVVGALRHLSTPTGNGLVAEK